MTSNKLVHTKDEESRLMSGFLCVCLLLYWLKCLLIRIVNINGCNQRGQAPHGDGQLVGVKEVVEEAVDEIAEKGEGSTQYQHLGLLALATRVGLEAAGHGDDN